MRTLLIALLFATIGFGLGWALRGKAAASRPVPIELIETPAFAPTDTPAPRRLVHSTQLAAPAAAPSNKRNEDAPANGAGSDYAERLRAIRLLKEAGLTLGGRSYYGDRVDPALARLLGLSDAETQQLSQLNTSARLGVDTARAAHATAKPSADGKQLIVEVPPLSQAQSGEHFDRFVESLRSTLGPERFVLFNELAGESVDAAFGHFGLAPMRYELTLQPTGTFPGTNQPLYRFRRLWSDATGASTGWTEGTLTPEQTKQSDPALARFLPLPK